VIPSERSSRSRWAYLGFLLLAAFVTGARSDYRRYIDQWQWIAWGHDPWSFPAPSLNAYGPLHVLSALPAAIHPLVPKLLFVVGWIVLGFFLESAWRSTQGSEPDRLGLWFWWASPYFLTEVVYNGHFDVVAAAFAALAIAWRDRRPFRAGLMLSCGILLKFIPLLILPFVLVERGKWRWRLLAGASVGLAVGFGACALRWGTTFLEPILFAAERPSSLMSVFRFLSGELSPLRPVGIDDLDALSLPLMAITGLAIGLFHLRAGWTSEGGALATVCLVLALYKVGHQQFYAVALVLLAAWMTQQARPWPKRLRWSAGTYVIWHAAFAVLYKWTGGFDKTLLREGVSGVVNLALTLYLVVEVARRETATGVTSCAVLSRPGCGRPDADRHRSQQSLHPPEAGRSSSVA
jgi:hypothetical protein